MPYSSVAEASSRVPGLKELSPEKKRVWVSAFNAALKQYGKEETAFRVAWAAIKKSGVDDMEDYDINTKVTLQVDGDKIAIGVPFEKVDAERRTVEGFATLDNVDKHGDIVDFEASREAFSNWLGNIREMHGPKAVGKALHIEEKQFEKEGSSHNGIWVKAYISKGAEDTWQKILDGTLKGFSVGGKVYQKRPEVVKNSDVFASRQVMRITKYMLGELSVVDNPANPLAMFTDMGKSLVKMVDGQVKASDTLAEEKKVYFCKSCNVAKVEPISSDGVECVTCDNQMTFIATSFEIPTSEEITKMIADFDFEKREIFAEETKSEGGEEETMDVMEKVAGEDRVQEINSSFVPDGVETLEAAAPADESPNDHLTTSTDSVVKSTVVEATESKEEVQLNNNEPNDTKMIDLLSQLVSAITQKVTKTVKGEEITPTVPVEDVVEKTEEGGELSDVDKANLDKILEILKSATSGIEDVMQKWSVQALNSEKATDVEVAETASLAAKTDDASLKVDGGQGVSTGLPSPPDTQVLPQITKSEDGGSEEVKDETDVEVGNELGKFAESFTKAIEGVGSRIEEMYSRLEKLENSGAGRKSAEVGEELKKSEDSMWGGVFNPKGL